MKNRIKTLVIAALCGTMLIGCGGNTRTTTISVGGGEAQIYEDGELVYDSNEVVAEEEPATTLVEEEPEPELLTDMTGIVVAYVEMEDLSSRPGERKIRLVTIDPETSEQKIWATIDIPTQCYLEPDYETSTNRWMFAEDYSKLAVSIWLQQDQAMHAGYIDVYTNEVVDVTKKLGLDKTNDFGNKQYHYGVRFDGDRLVYVTTEKGELYDGENKPEGQAYSVPANQISTSNVEEYELQFIPEYARLSDANNEYQIVDDYPVRIEFQKFHNESHLVNSAGEEIDYIPESDRANWSGKFSPDDSKIAFLSSRPGEDTEMFIKDLNSEAEPRKLNVTFPWGTIGMRFYAYKGSDPSVCYATQILEWR